MSEAPTPTPTTQELIQKYANINELSYEQAEAEVNAPTVDEVLKNIEDKTLEKIRSQMPPLNRAQRRALAKKNKSKNKTVSQASKAEVIAETTKKLNYIKLIEELREMNKKKENEKYVEDAIETH